MTFGICHELFEGWPFDRVCRLVRTIGYDALELAPFTFAESVTDWPAADRARTRAVAADHGLAIIGFHWLLAKTEGLHLTSPDAATRARTARYLVALGRACHDVGGRVLVLGSPQQRRRLPGVSADEAMAYAAQTVRAAMPAIGDLGVSLCLEPLSPAETDVMNTCAEAMTLIAAVDHPACRLQLDVKAMASEPTPIVELIRRYAPYAGHVHANDPSRRGPGFGDQDFVPIFHALAAAGYAGALSVEVFDFSPDPETIARRSFEYMSRCRVTMESPT